MDLFVKRNNYSFCFIDYQYTHNFFEWIDMNTFLTYIPYRVTDHTKISQQKIASFLNYKLSFFIYEATPTNMTKHVYYT